MPGRILEWRPVIPKWGETDPHVWVSTSKLDCSWRQSSHYVSHGGGGDAIGQRYPRFGEWLALRQPIDMCTVGIVEDRIEFSDGRHRFAWLRDHGVTAIPVQTSADLIDEIAHRYGAISQVSVLPDPT